MEHTGINSVPANGGRAQRLPPRRGQIKIKILRSVVKSATAFASAASGGFGRRSDGEDGASLSSASPSPHTTSGYNSDA